MMLGAMCLTLPPINMQPDVSGVLFWTIFILKGPPKRQVLAVNWYPIDRGQREPVSLGTSKVLLGPPDLRG